jgi:transcriptional regulator with XRE-family HTH domain
VLSGRMPGDQTLATAIGRIIRDGRLECGWSQRELASRLGVSQSAIARLEGGELEYIDIGLLTRVLDHLGIRISFDSRTLGLAGRREQRDAIHAACAGYAKGRLDRASWATALEVEIGAGRGRGWIDLLGYRDADRALLVVEFKTEIHDVGQIQRSLAWYGREAWRAARSRGWRPRSVSILLLVLDTIEKEARVRASRELLLSELPVRGRELDAWLRASGGPPIRGLAMIDPRSRRVDWLRPTRAEGRRTSAAYVDYRDAAQRISRR